MNYWRLLFLCHVRKARARNALIVVLDILKWTVRNLIIDMILSCFPFTWIEGESFGFFFWQEFTGWRFRLVKVSGERLRRIYVNVVCEGADWFSSWLIYSVWHCSHIKTSLRKLLSCSCGVDNHEFLDCIWESLSSLRSRWWWIRLYLAESRWWCLKNSLILVIYMLLRISLSLF
jgi:hypothetical protein